MIDYQDSEEYRSQKERFTWNKVRLRNLKINIAKVLISKNDVNKVSFSKKDLSEIFSFKEYDFKYLTKFLFCVFNGKYTLKNEIKMFLDKVFSSNELVRNYLPSAEVEFIKIYGEYRDGIERNKHDHYLYEEYQKMYERIKDILPILHWGKLPIFNRYLIYNRKHDPEMEMIEFYNHIDCLNALLSELRNNGIKLSNESDKSLNRDVQFKVYTRRWRHEVNYIIKRTVDGWYCSHIAINGKCKKDGTGGLISNLNHDCVFFPEDGVKYAMQKLWEDADDGRIDFDELSNRIQQIANWISTVEKSICSQPEWVNYY